MDKVFKILRFYTAEISRTSREVYVFECQWEKSQDRFILWESEPKGRRCIPLPILAAMMPTTGVRVGNWEYVDDLDLGDPELGTSELLPVFKGSMDCPVLQDWGFDPTC